VGREAKDGQLEYRKRRRETGNEWVAGGTSLRLVGRKNP